MKKEYLNTKLSNIFNRKELKVEIINESAESSPKSTDTVVEKFQFENFSSRASTPDLSVLQSINVNNLKLKPAVNSLKSKPIPVAPPLPGTLPPALNSFVKQNVSNELNEEDLVKPIDQIRSKVNRLSSQDIINKNLIKKAADLHNPSLVFKLIDIISKNNNPDVKAPLLQGIEALIINYQLMIAVEENTLQELLIAKESIRPKYESIKNTSLNDPSLQNSLAEVISKERPLPKLTPHRQKEAEEERQEKRRIAAINLTYPNLGEKQEKEQEEANKAFLDQEDKILKLKKLVINCIKTSVTSGVIDKEDIMQILGLLENKVIKKQFIKEIDSIKLDNKNKSEQTSTKNIDVMQEKFSDLSPEITILTNERRSKLQMLNDAADRVKLNNTKTDKEALRTIQEEFSIIENDLVENILAEMTPIAIKLNKLQQKLHETGNDCNYTNDLINISFEKHYGKALINDEMDSKQKMNFEIGLNKWKKALKLEISNPENLTADEYTPPNSLEEIKNEIKDTLIKIGVREEIIEFRRNAIGKFTNMVTTTRENNNTYQR